MPYVGDSKRAMDEYTSEIFMGGKVSALFVRTVTVDATLANAHIRMDNFIGLEHDRDAQHVRGLAAGGAADH